MVQYIAAVWCIIYDDDLLRDFEFPSTMIKMSMLFKIVSVSPELFAICNCHITGDCYNPT